MRSIRSLLILGLSGTILAAAISPSFNESLCRGVNKGIKSLEAYITKKDANKPVPQSIPQLAPQNPGMPDVYPIQTTQELNSSFRYDPHSRMTIHIVDPEHAKVPYDPLIFNGDNTPGTLHHYFEDIERNLPRGHKHDGRYDLR